MLDIEVPPEIAQPPFEFGLREAYPRGVLLDALGSICRGEVYIQSDLVGDLLELKNLFETFTKKEKQIAEILDLNITNAEIAEKVGLSLGTVENYIGKLYDKTGTSTRVEFLRKLGKL